MGIEKMMRMNQLFGFYANLLTIKQQEMLQLYYEEDFSLSEIADHYQVSRQAVRDNLKRAELALEQYEANLQLLKRREQRLHLLQQLSSFVEPDGQQLLQQIQAMDN